MVAFYNLYLQSVSIHVTSFRANLLGVVSLSGTLEVHYGDGRLAILALQGDLSLGLSSAKNLLLVLSQPVGATIFVASDRLSLV